MFLLKDTKAYNRVVFPVFLSLVFFALFVGFSMARATERPERGVEAGAGAEKIPAGIFAPPIDKAGTLPAGWKPLYFPSIASHTQYVLEAQDNDLYLRAKTDGASASALYRDLDFDIGEYPVLSWRWKIDDVLEKGDARMKAGDDYAARLYVTFAFETSRATFLERARQTIGKRLFSQSPPGSTLNYIWANKVKKGRFILNPYTDKAMMIAVQSGAELAGLWVVEERNVYEDYIKAFGHKPPPVIGVAVMTDSDNTNGSATGYYDDIIFRKDTTRGKAEVRP